MTYNQFVTELNTNTELRKYSTTALAKKLKISENQVRDYRVQYRLKKGEQELQVALPVTPKELEIVLNSGVNSKPNNIPGYNISSFKVSKDGTPAEAWYKADETIQVSIDLDFLREELLNNVPSIPVPNKSVSSSKKIILWLGDAHIGIKVDNEAVLSNQVIDFRMVVNKALSLITEEFAEVIVVYGGDMTDSFLNQTSRGGHNLPSNLTDREMFQKFITDSQYLFLSLSQNPLVGSISFYSVSEDNHTASLAGIFSASLELWLNAALPSVHTEVFKRMIDYFVVDDHTFIVTHGKDGKEMFKNLPLILDPKTESYLMSWMLSQEMIPNYKTHHVVKFDLHQSSRQVGRFFSYMNCLSCQVGSKWQQHNFMSSTPGFNYTIIQNSNLINGEYYL